MRNAILVSASLVLFASFAACTGDEDSLGDAPAAGGSSGASGASGSAGTAGSAGAGGTAGTGGTAGSGGTAGTAGTGGTAGSAGTGGTAGSAGTGGTSSDPKWGCIGPVTPGTPEAANLTVTVKVVNGLSSAALANASVRACAIDDLDCSNPLDGGAKITPATGEVTFSVPGGTNGFDGYFDVSVATYYPTLQMLAFPITKNNTSVNIPLAGVSLFNGVAAGIVGGAGNIKADRGHMTLGAYTCAASNDAAGVTAAFAAADATTKIAYGGTLPNASATETAANTSRVFILNAPVGASTVTATLKATAQTIGTYPVIIRAGSITATGFYPQPQ